MTEGPITWHDGELPRERRWALLGARGATVWLTGLSGSGKSTIASALERRLVEAGRWAYRPDGDNLRHGLCAGLGFSEADRKENVRRAGEAAALMADAGLVAIVALISPYRADRAAARAAHDRAGLPFFEVWVDTPLEVCESRDPKGLYKKARAGEIKGFTGIDDPFEAPTAPELELRTDQLSIEESVAALVNMLDKAGILKAD